MKVLVIKINFFMLKKQKINFNSNNNNNCYNKIKTNNIF